MYHMIHLAHGYKDHKPTRCARRICQEGKGPRRYKRSYVEGFRHSRRRKGYAGNAGSESEIRLETAKAEMIKPRQLRKQPAGPTENQRDCSHRPSSKAIVSQSPNERQGHNERTRTKST